MIEKIKKDFPNLDLSFIMEGSEINYCKCSNNEEFSDKFFKKIDDESLINNVQIIVGESKIKYYSRVVFNGEILACFISNNGNGLKYSFMGVKS